MTTIDSFTVEDFKQIDEEELRQAQRLYEILDRLYGPSEVFDVGCATGLYLEPFAKKGVKVIGFEPEFKAISKAGLNRISQDRVFPVGFLSTIYISEPDLVLCLEVLEHIPEEDAYRFIKKLCAYHAPIVFSAARPGQEGKGHINCQPKEYWEELFQNFGFERVHNIDRMIVEYMQNGYHLGWLTQNLMVFERSVENTDSVTYVDNETFKSLLDDDEIFDESDMTRDELTNLWLEGAPVEVMNVDPNTGGMKASKPSQLGFIDPQALITLGEVAGMGAEKYDKFNYLKGFDWSLAYNAMMRHAHAAWNGEDIDEESGLPHFAHAAWQALALLSFYQRDLGNDDRPSTLMEFNKGED